ncbi:MAG: cytochrome c class [Acidimicrobiia bacterium]|nr:cytochrome c class [Acidimicrobiia bacterium]
MWSKVAVLLMGVGAVAGGWRGATSRPEAAAVGNPDRGRLQFESDCATCHAPDGSGSYLGPSIRTVGMASVDFQIRTGRMPLLGNDPSRRANPHYTEQQIADLVAYTGTIVTGPPIPTVDPHASTSNGQELYQLNCAACHHAAAVGGVLANNVQVPSLTHSTPEQVVEAMRTGPGQMPIFTKGFTDEQASEVAAYVQYLRHPRDRGGLTLGHLGPVPEGLVALALGLGGCIAFARWLGTREPAGRSGESTD